MKIVTVLGTRPEIIRLSQVIPALDAASEHVLVHTGQNSDPLLNDIFFSGLGVRAPDVFLGIEAQSFGEQIGRIIAESEQVLRREKPDRVLILGDTNSGLAGFVACRMGIPVYHMEAGNRCFDDRVPEEVNRRVIDHSSRVNMPYTERSRANLLREGMPSDRIFVVGNPIFEVLEAQRQGIDASTVHDRLGVEPGEYFAVTTHRQENVDIESRLRAIVGSLVAIHDRHELPVVWSVHPRTKSKLEAFNVQLPSEITIIDALGFHDFVALERDARCVLTDSGLVQEETCILRVPNVTLRDTTERPETVECGSNILAGVRTDDVIRAVSVAMASSPSWTPPVEYLYPHVSRTVANVVLGYSDVTRPDPQPVR